MKPPTPPPTSTIVAPYVSSCHGKSFKWISQNSFSFRVKQTIWLGSTYCSPATNHGQPKNLQFRPRGLPIGIRHQYKLTWVRNTGVANTLILYLACVYLFSKPFPPWLRSPVRFVPCSFCHAVGGTLRSQ